MDKYSSLYQAIYSIFATNGWKAEAIPTFPTNFVGSGVDEYIRISIVASGDADIKSATGQVIIDIFYPAGGGSLRAITIADKLDKYLAGKTVNSAIQFFSSTLTEIGNDTANASLYRSKYSIPFNYFGV